MTQRSILCLLLAGSLAALATGCKNPPGKPREGVAEERPEHVVEFATLYKQNCAACHGANGQLAASISLNNPTYLAIAGEANIAHAISAGIPGTMMPAFGKAAGGMLTDQQIAALAHGMETEWDRTTVHLDSSEPFPPYASVTKGDVGKGEQAFNTFCASCHGAGGTGKDHTGPIVDPAYLALVNDQYLRSNILAGKPESGMPDWSQHTLSGAKQVMTDAEITDIVAWIGSHRVVSPGQPYQQHP